LCPDAFEPASPLSPAFETPDASSELRTGFDKPGLARRCLLSGELKLGVLAVLTSVEPLVTWGTEMTLSYYPNSKFTEASTDVTLPSHIGFNWATNRQTIENVITQKSGQPVAGGTNLSSGLDMANQVLSGANGRSLSSKVIILLTDSGTLAVIPSCLQELRLRPASSCTPSAC
jgi:hypothetical protein